jgi:hypothetical protein
MAYYYNLVDRTITMVWLKAKPTGIFKKHDIFPNNLVNLLSIYLEFDFEIIIQRCWQSHPDSHNKEGKFSKAPRIVAITAL